MLFGCFAFSQTYFDSRQNRVNIPGKSNSFADEVVEFKNGYPSSEGFYAKSKFCLGKPDFVKWKKPGVLSLGCGGSVTVKFTNNAIIDVPGDDIYVFESGDRTEPFKVEISRFGYHWIDVGNIESDYTGIDISGVTLHDDEFFHFVRITDLGNCKTSPTVGADIDAIGAIGSINKGSKIKSLFKETDLVYYRDNITVRTTELTISLWDNAQDDGDIISLFLNNEKDCVLQNHRVANAKETIKVKLKEDINLLILYAVNEGSLPPNTAAIRIDDGYNVQNVVLRSDKGKSEAIKIRQKK